MKRFICLFLFSIMVLVALMFNTSCYLFNGDCQGVCYNKFLTETLNCVDYKANLNTVGDKYELYRITKEDYKLTARVEFTESTFAQFDYNCEYLVNIEHFNNMKDVNVKIYAVSNNQVIFNSKNYYFEYLQADEVIRIENTVALNGEVPDDVELLVLIYGGVYK